MKGWYLYLATTRWFGIRIDMLVAVFVAAVAFISIPLSSRKQTSVINVYFEIHIDCFTFKMSFIRVECWFSRSRTNVQCFTCWHVSVLCETEC